MMDQYITIFCMILNSSFGDMYYLTFCKWCYLWIKKKYNLQHDAFNSNINQNPEIKLAAIIQLDSQQTIN